MFKLILPASLTAIANGDLDRPAAFYPATFWEISSDHRLRRRDGREKLERILREVGLPGVLSHEPAKQVEE